LLTGKDICEYDISIMKYTIINKHRKAVRYCLFWGAVFLISQIHIATILSSLGIDYVLQLQLTDSPREFREILLLWENLGVLDRYKTHFYPDMLHPLWYGLFLSYWALSLFRGRVERGIFVALSVSAAICDVAENLFHIAFLKNSVFITEGLLKISSVLTGFKWIVALGLMGLFTVTSIFKSLTFLLKRGGFVL